MKKSSSFLENNLTFVLVATICVLVVARLAILPFSPPLFWLDESAGSAHVASMVQHGTNAFGQPWPLFSAALGGGYTTPVFLYPSVVWSFVFGFSPVSLRFLSEFMTLAAIGLIAYALRLWVDRRTALIAACVGLALPWGWLQGSLAWDPAFVPFFTGLAFLAFSELLFTKSKKVKYAMLFLLPISLVLLAYLYPPLRVSAPLMFIGAYALLFKKKIVNWRQLAVTVVGAAIISLPLLHFMQDPDSLSRSQNLIVFSIWPFPQAVGAFFVNMIQLMTPWFFFINGDYNSRHSTGFEGMLGWAEIPALIAIVIVIVRKWNKKWDDRLLVSIALFGMLASMAGSALTFEAPPQSLRATAAWPFIVILLALGWRWIIAHKNKKYLYGSLALFAIGTIMYAIDLAFVYPTQSAKSFDHSTYEKAIRHQPTPGYSDLSLKYYESL